MQVPAPFEYERADSVDHAIGLLDRLGRPARLVAGGHSLLPMMKLRLANFEYLIDINDLHDELGYITVEPDQIRIGAHDPAPGAARVRRAGRGLPDLPRRRAGDRRPGGAQPGHPRRLALPGRPVRGPVRGLHDAERELRDPRPGRRAGGDHGGVPPRPVRDRGRGRRDPRRGAHPGPPRRVAARTRRSSGGPATGPWCPAGAAVWMDGGGDHRRPGRAWPPSARTPPASRRSRTRCAARQPSEELYAAGRRDRRGRAATRSPTSAAAPTTSATWPTS